MKLRIPQHRVSDNIIQIVKNLLHEREQYRNTLQENPEAKNEDDVCRPTGKDY